LFVHPSIAAAQGSAGISCLDPAQAVTVTIARITDGDTVVLEDNRRVRLIGINTLELNTPDKQDLAMAIRARQALDDFFDNRQAQIIIGRDELDRHGRLLAHLGHPDGRDAAQTLVASGLGLAVAVGSNTRCADTLHSLELQARESSLGIWQSPGSWYLDKHALTGHERGFHVACRSSSADTGRNTVISPPPG
jgi:endonuclease YncB( thermonuclease family)